MELLKVRKPIRRIISTVIIINLFLVVISGCTRSRNDDDEFYGYRQHGKSWDRCDCLHRHAFMEKEFFDARDFRPDSIYGSDHGRRDEE
jgi:hypothetical protein